MITTQKDLITIKRVVNDSSPISEFNHCLYKYPARFSPLLARELINLFSKPGDIVLDPFMGSGTTLVEALASGRKAVGVDISELSYFITIVKITPLTNTELEKIKYWAEQNLKNFNVKKPDQQYRQFSFLNDHCIPWQLRKVVLHLLIALRELDNQRLRNYARAAVLQVTQWALDCKRSYPSVKNFKRKLLDIINENNDGMVKYRQLLSNNFNTSRSIHRSSRVYSCSCEQLTSKMVSFNKVKPKLIITSPPYPGVHVVYHRWQLLGRKETDYPFKIANCYNGRGESFYTLGSRYEVGLHKYFENAEKSFKAIRNVIDPESLIFQLVGFSDREKYFKKYLSMMEKAGFVEENLIETENVRRMNRLWRNVPNRKWYADYKGRTHSSKEVLLIHRPI